MSRCLICLKMVRMGRWYDFCIFWLPKAEFMTAMDFSGKMPCLVFITLCPEDKKWSLNNVSAATLLIEDRLQRVKLTNE